MDIFKFVLRAIGVDIVLEGEHYPTQVGCVTLWDLLVVPGGVLATMPDLWEVIRTVVGVHIEDLSKIERNWACSGSNWRRYRGHA